MLWGHLQAPPNLGFLRRCGLLSGQENAGTRSWMQMRGWIPQFPLKADSLQAIQPAGNGISSSDTECWAWRSAMLTKHGQRGFWGLLCILLVPLGDPLLPTCRADTHTMGTVVASVAHLSVTKTK